jgi:hypothetical protein
VELCLLFLESLLSLIELVEVSTLSFAVIPELRGFLASGGVGRSGLTFRGALVGVGGVDRIVSWSVGASFRRGVLSASS